VDSRELGQDKI